MKPYFAKFVLDVGNGTLNAQNDNLDLPQHCILESNCNIASTIFGKFIQEKKFEANVQFKKYKY